MKHMVIFLDMFRLILNSTRSECVCAWRAWTGSNLINNKWQPANIL